MSNLREESHSRYCACCISSKSAGEAFIITDGLDITWREFTDKLSETIELKAYLIYAFLELGYAVAAGMEKVLF